MRLSARGVRAARGSAMKCQRCPKQATLHITEVLGEDRFDEVHLCEDCAKKYLYEPQQKKLAKGAPAAAEADEDAPAGAKCPSAPVFGAAMINTYRGGGNTKGSRFLTHFMTAAWDSDQGQRIGCAREVEGAACPPPAPPAPGR